MKVEIIQPTSDMAPVFVRFSDFVNNREREELDQYLNRNKYFLKELVSFGTKSTRYIDVAVKDKTSAEAIKKHFAGGKSEDTNDSKKNDRIDGKPDFSLLHLEYPEIEEVVRIYEAGERKYGRDTWENLEDGERRYFAALLRHANAHHRGEILDPEDGCYHIAKVIWNAIAMAHSYFINNPRPQDKQ